MNNLTEVNIALIFPQGAHFYQNIYQYVYKEFMKFIYKMSCYTVDQKCSTCPFSKECRYCYCTGENYQYYPGVLIENPLFSQSIFSDQDVLNFKIYFIGDNKQYVEYVKLFFEMYLKQKIAGQYFYLKGIQVKSIQSQNINVSHLLINTLIEDTDIISSYNSMIKYYNEKYHTDYEINSINPFTQKRIKKSQLDSIYLKTKYIKPKGYIYSVFFQNDFILSSDFSKIGIGKYNFIGGGQIEN